MSAIKCLEGKRHSWPLSAEGVEQRCTKCHKLNTEVGHPANSERHTLKRHNTAVLAKAEKAAAAPVAKETAKPAKEKAA